MTVSVMENKIYLILYFAHQQLQMKKERKNIVRTFKSMQKRETSTINTMTIIRTWSQQRESSVTVRWIEQRKMSFLKLVLKNIKKWIRQKRNNVLKIGEKNINRWTFPKKKTIVKQNC